MYRFRDKARYWSRFFHTPPAFDARLRGSLGILPYYLHGKNRMVDYRLVKKFENMFSSFHYNTRTWQTGRRTDIQTPCHSTSRAKMLTMWCWAERRTLGDVENSFCWHWFVCSEYERIIIVWRNSGKGCVVSLAIERLWFDHHHVTTLHCRPSCS